MRPAENRAHAVLIAYGSPNMLGDEVYALLVAHRVPERVAFRFARERGWIQPEPVCESCLRTIPAADIAHYRAESGEDDFPAYCEDCAEASVADRRVG